MPARLPYPTPDNTVGIDSRWARPAPEASQERDHAHTIGERIVALYRLLEITDKQTPKTARLWNQIRIAEAELDATSR